MSSTNPTLSPEQAQEVNRVFQIQQAHQWQVAQTTAKQRIQKLDNMYDMLLRYRDEMKEAVHKDFSKAPIETDFSEIGNLTQAIRHAKSKLRAWMRPERVSTPLVLLGARSRLYSEPKGVVLIISPWNYPYLLTFEPLIYAIAAGNTAILKPSEMTPNAAAVMKKMISETFEEEEVALFEGEVELSKHLLSLPFNHIFFTGSPMIGKAVMQAASKHLASVTLELGGKSPFVVDKSADLDRAASRVVWMKGMNGGQICIAPDYVLVHEDIVESFKAKVQEKIGKHYGSTPDARMQNPDLCRIVNANHYRRIKGLLEDAEQYGAEHLIENKYDAEQRFIDISPLLNVGEGAKVWEEEIFGPLLPMRTYATTEEAIGYIRNRPTPLAVYIFSKNNTVTQRLLRETKAGGVTVNDVAVHTYNHSLPFGGHNNSGIGKTHGIHGFRAFSNQKSVVYQSPILPGSDLVLPPYNRGIAKWLVNAIVKWL